MEVQQIRSPIPRQKRFLFAPIDNRLTRQQDGHRRSAFRPHPDGCFVLMLQPAIFSASHSYSWMQPDGRQPKSGGLIWQRLQFVRRPALTR
jgi:hypothetical protein